MLKIKKEEVKMQVGKEVENNRKLKKRQKKLLEEKKQSAGITLIALVVTLVVDLVSYDKNRKYSNLVVFSL